MSQMAGSSRTGILIGHLCAGFVVGTLFGYAYFILEVLVGFWGRYESLGAPLTRILGAYLLFGIVVGVIGGLVIGAVCASRGLRWSAGRYVPLYLSSFTFLLIVMYSVRNHTIADFKSILKSAELIWFLVLMLGVTVAGYFVSRLVSSKPLDNRIRTRTVLLVVILCNIAVGALQAVPKYREGRLPPDRAGASCKGPNVILIVLDALRADHVSAYGYHRPTTPNTDRLAREGVLFRNAHADGNRTVLSVPSIFTSLYPSYHGVIDRGKLIRGLPRECTTAAELFRENGYTTIGLTGNPYFSPVFGFARGFDRFERFHAERYFLGLYKLLWRSRVIERPSAALQTHAGAGEVTDRALCWLRRLGDRPFFMYVHYMDNHHPYSPPPPYDTRFGNTQVGPDPMKLFAKTTRALEASPVELGADDLAKLEDYYDGSIRFEDDQIGRLIGGAERASKEREIVVVITSDHGDEFLEHGSLYHNNLVFEELIHVPLIVWSSKRFARGSEVDCLVRHVDVLPTLAELIGADVPAEAMGKSLVPLLEGRIPSIDVESIAEGFFCTSLNYKNWKIMRVDSTDSYALYDLSRTPGEKADLSAALPYVYAMMHARLAAYLEAARAVKRSRLIGADKETIRELKAHGYL